MTTTPTVRPRRFFDYRFHQVALAVALVGAIVGFSAALYAFLVDGRVIRELIVGSAFAVTAAVPVYKNYLRLKRECGKSVGGDEIAPRVS